MTPAPVRGQVQGVESAGRMTWHGIGAAIAGGVAQHFASGTAKALVAVVSIAITGFSRPAPCSPHPSRPRPGGQCIELPRRCERRARPGPRGPEPGPCRGGIRNEGAALTLVDSGHNQLAAAASDQRCDTAMDLEFVLGQGRARDAVSGPSRISLATKLFENEPAKLGRSFPN